jgi:autotransporter passenger strand-loop-strand repeat protein
MATFTVPAGTILNSDSFFGPLGPADIELVYGTVFTTTDGGEQDVEVGGLADLTTIVGGFQFLFGGTALNTTIQAGFQEILSGLNPDGSSVPGSATNTIINGGEQDVLSGTADTTTINSGGMQVVVGGGTASRTTINQGGHQLVTFSDFGSGVATHTTINGGMQTIYAGTATETTINSGEQDVGSSAQNGGNPVIAETTEIIGGLQLVAGLAENTTIVGGTMEMTASGGTNGTPITFAGIGTLLIDQPVSGTAAFASPLAGVQFGDTVDLAGLPFVTGATAAFTANSLTVTSGTNSETFTLQTLDPNVTGFVTTPDSNGGTDVMAVGSPPFSIPLPPTVPIIWDNLGFGVSIALPAAAVIPIVSLIPNSGTTVIDANGLPNINIVGLFNGFNRLPASAVSGPSGDPSDTLTGADSGRDVFVFAGSFGHNTINHFITKEEGNHDILAFSKAQFGDLATMMKNGDIQQVGADTLITNPLNPADTVKLTGVSALELESHPSNFHFV